MTGRPSNTWIVDFGVEQTEADASLFEAPFIQVQRAVKPQRIAIADGPAHWFWWRHERPRPLLRKGLAGLSRFLATPRVAKYRLFVFLDATVLPDTRLNVIARADDLTFGILSNRLHEVWSLANTSMHGVGNDPTYNAKSCFKTFPHSLTPADTAHQTTETLPGGETIPAGLPGGSVSANSTSKPGVVKAFNAGTAIKKVANSAAIRSGQVVRTHAIAIAQAAYRLNALREAWLNPPEWTQRLPEVIPLGMASSPYPDRIVAKLGHDKDLAERTLTKLYNQRPAWLAAAHHTLDMAVAAAYDWADYSVDMADDELLKRSLALNLARAAQ